MSTTKDNQNSTTAPKPQKPLSAPPVKRSALPDKIPEFPGDDSAGKPG